MQHCSKVHLWNRILATYSDQQFSLTYSDCALVQGVVLHLCFVH